MTRTALPLIALLTASPALAHVAPDGHGGFGAGFGHPFGGLDHLLAMVAVGLLAIQIGGRARWALPASFLAAMVAGALLAFGGADWSYAEIAIAGSVPALGLMLAAGRAWPVAAATAVVAAFAFFHGLAHGSEAPAATSFLAYGGGFLLATALLHLFGIGSALAAGGFMRQGKLATRLGGVAILACGIALIAA